MKPEHLKYPAQINTFLKILNERIKDRDNLFPSPTNDELTLFYLEELMHAIKDGRANDEFYSGVVMNKWESESKSNKEEAV